MDRVQLKNFVLLAQTLNYSATAKQEFISQPALTKQINRLEEELGVRLFHRTRHDVTLTYAGEQFYTHALEILEHIDKAERHMDSIQRGRTGALQISVILGLDQVVSRSLGAFYRQYPEVDVNIMTGTGSQQTLTINSQSADVYFSYAPLLALFTSLETIPLPSDRFAVFIHRQYEEKLAQYGLAYLDRLENLIEVRSEGGPVFTNLIFAMRDALGLTSGNIRYYASNATIMMAVQAGMGFAFLPAQMDFGLCPEDVMKIPLDIPEAEIKRAIGWHTGSKNTAAAHFVEIVRQMNGEDNRRQ